MKGFSRVLLLCLALLILYGISQLLPSSEAAAEEQSSAAPRGFVASFAPHGWRVEKQDYFERYMQFSFSQVNSTSWKVNVTLESGFWAGLSQCLASCDLNQFRSAFGLNESPVTIATDLLQASSYPIASLSPGLRIEQDSVDIRSGSASFVISFEGGFASGKAFRFGLRSAHFNSTSIENVFLRNVHLVKDSSGNYWAAFPNGTGSSDGIVLFNSTNPSGTWVLVNATILSVNGYAELYPTSDRLQLVFGRPGNGNVWSSKWYNITANSNNTAVSNTCGAGDACPRIVTNVNASNGIFVFVDASLNPSFDDPAIPVQVKNSSNLGDSFNVSIRGPRVTDETNIEFDCDIDKNDLIHCVYQNDTPAGGITRQGLMYFNYSTRSHAFSTVVSLGGDNTSIEPNAGILVDDNFHKHILYKERNSTQTFSIWYMNISASGVISAQSNLTNTTVNWSARMTRTGNHLVGIFVDTSQNVTYYAKKYPEWGALSLYRRNARGLSPRGSVNPNFNNWPNNTLEFLWLNTTTSSDLQLQYDTITINSGPVINSVRLNASSIGGSQNLTLQVNVTDADAASERDNTSFGSASTRTYSGDLATLDIGDGLNQAGNVTANDTFGVAGANFTVNWSLTNRTYQQNSSFAHNLTLQRIQKNDTLLNNASSASLSYNITHRIPVEATVVAGGNFSGTLTAGNAVNVSTEFSGDWLSETWTSEAQETANTTEAGVNAFTRFVLNATNNATDSITFTAVNLSGRCRSGWTQNITSRDVASSGLTNFVIGCNLSTTVTKARVVYNITGATVTVGQNSTGFMEVRTNNTDTVASYNEILVNASTGGLIPSNWVLNDSVESYRVNLSANTASLRNTTIRTNSSLVAFLSPQAADCTGFTIFTDYCEKDTTETLADGRTRHNQTIRHKINSTDSVVKDFEIVVPMNLTRFTNWESRESGSVKGEANRSTTNISVVSDATFVNLTVGTSYSTSSLSPGFYLVDVNYSWITGTPPQGSGGSFGGGGGGGVTIIQQLVAGNVSFSIIPASFGRPLNPGDEFTEDLVIRCTSSEACDVTVTVEQFEQDPSWRWLTIRLGNNALTSHTFKAAPGTILVPGTAQFNASIRVPVDAREGSYRAFLAATVPNARPVRVPVTVSIGGAFCPTCVFQDFLAWFLAPVGLPRAFLGITAVSPVQVAGAFVTLGLVVWYARFLTNGKKKR